MCFEALLGGLIRLELAAARAAGEALARARVVDDGARISQRNEPGVTGAARIVRLGSCGPALSACEMLLVCAYHYFDKRSAEISLAICWNAFIRSAWDAAL
jgi:hypothetical protein